MSNNNEYQTQLFSVSIPSKYSSEITPSQTIINPITTNIDYFAPNALEQAFSSIPIISEQCYQHISSCLATPIKQLQNGETVAFLTENVYGLGAD